MKKSNEPTKTNEAMKTMKKFLSMATLALVGAVMTGCSSDDSLTGNAQEPAVKNNVVTLTTTVNLGDGTRALDADGKKTFAAGDKIAVIYKNTSGETMKAESEPLASGGSSLATFSFELTDPDKTANVTYIYPAAMAGATDVDYTKLASQDGTLATISSSLDLATYSAAWDGNSLPTATLANQLAILAYTIKNADASNDLTSTITGMTISDGTNNYSVTRSATTGPIYVAIQPTTSANIEYTATDGTKTYTKSVTGKTYAAGNIYQLGLKMTEAASAPAGVEAVDLGLSVKWANMNVGAESVTDYGKYYAWGATTDNYSQSKDYNWANTPYYTGNGSTHSWSKYASAPATLDVATDDAARANWGGSWRMPTESEFSELLSNTTRTWQTNYQGVSGCNGYLFTSTKSGYESKSIFLPAAGSRYGSSLNSGGSIGFYWSSTLDSGNVDDGRFLRFFSGNAYMGYNYRFLGFTVRAVQ